MAITLSGTNGLFTRLGKLGALVNSILNSQGAGTLTAPTQSIGTNFTNLEAQFTSTALQADMFANWVADVLVPFRTKPGVLDILKAKAQTWLIRQVSDDTPLPEQTLSAAWTELVRQVAVNGGPGYFTAGTISATTPAAISGATGTAAASSSVTGPLLPGGAVGVTGSGAMVLQYVFPETIVLRCTADSYTGGATKYSETFSFTAPSPVVTDRLAWNWSSVYGAVANNGSGASGTISVCDAALYAEAGAGGNLLQNGDFLHFTVADTPDNWTIVTGSAGTGIKDGGVGTGVIGGSSKSFKAVFDATPTLLCIKQPFANVGVTGGTTSSLLPDTVLAGGVWLKADAANVGNINFALVDGTSSLGTLISDNNAVTNTAAVDLSTLTTSYVFYPFFFRTPHVLPATGCYLKIHFSGSLVNTKTVSVSNLALKVAQQAYTGGPYFALFSGGTGSVLGDGINMAFANNWGALTNKNGWVQMLDVLFDIRANSLPTVPLVGSTLLADTMVA